MLNTELAAAQAGDRQAFESMVIPHIRGLKAHCYRMSGSWYEAEDLLQESLVRAWKGIGTFRGSSTLKTWLYTVATRVCLDLLRERRARTLPFALAPAAPGTAPPGPPDPEIHWLEPMPGEPDDEARGPEARLGQKESVAYAFLTLVQQLPPRQRAVLLLRDVLGWSANECAELLETTVASVNSALQRAREGVGDPVAAPAKVADPGERDLLARYVKAWETADVESLVGLLVEGATLAMPPLSAWYQGAEAIGWQLRTMAMPPESAGRRRFQVTRANGMPAIAVWRMDPAVGEFRAEAIHVLDLQDHRVKAITAFLDPALFPGFGLATAIPG